MTAEEWLYLYQRCPAASPFLHPAWQSAWSDCFGTCPLRELEVRRRGDLVALARCYEYEGRLVFTGNGISDSLDVLAVDAEAARELMHQLSFHRLNLQEIPATSPLVGRFPHTAQSVSPAIDLAQKIPSKLMRTLRQQMRYLGDHRSETRQSPELLQHLFDLHALRSHSRGEAGVLADPVLQAFQKKALNPLVRMRCAFI